MSPPSEDPDRVDRLMGEVRALADIVRRVRHLEDAAQRQLGAIGVIGAVASEDDVKDLTADVKALTRRVIAIEKAIGAGRAVRTALLALPGVIGGIAGVWALVS